jgi:hypothetical protein
MTKQEESNHRAAAVTVLRTVVASRRPDLRAVAGWRAGTVADV